MNRHRRHRRAIYMDHHATTPVDPEVLRAMWPYFTKKFGNSASQNLFGRQTAEAVERARQEVAQLIGAESREIVFTSGATESDNLAIKGVAEAYRKRGDHILTQATEHKAVLDSCKRLEMAGFKVTYLPVGADGILDIGDLKRAITDKTILISVMFANNEVGVLQPMAELGRIAKERGILFHSDAVQAAGKVPMDVKTLKVDLLSITAHKMYGPKGIGALYIRKGGVPAVKLVPMMDGGGHETGFRSGTLNVPGIVGFGRACRISRRVLQRESKRVAGLRDKLRNGLLEGLGDCTVNGSQKRRLPNNLNISFPNVQAKLLMRELRGIAVSSGSACISTSLESSYVLKALGVQESLRHSSIRFGLGRFNTEEEVDVVTKKVVAAVKKLRKL